jgi:hypothetical protein
MERTIELVKSLRSEEAARPVRVPPMRGVDEDMREWSLFMILEHNTIVNREMSRAVQCLARGEVCECRIDPKRDVMPSHNAGPEQIEPFRVSVESHLRMVAELPRLRNTRKYPHIIVGPLDAHGWHCLLGLHLYLHRKQAETVVEILRAERLLPN